MAKKNITESGKVIEKTARYQPTTTPKLSSSMQGGDKLTLTPRLSPISRRVSTTPPTTTTTTNSRGASPRTSPGLLAGHYAGCKWSAPPSPSTLPLPPQHWMQASSHSVRLPFLHHHHQPPMLEEQHNNIANQLKMLLKVQA